MINKSNYPHIFVVITVTLMVYLWSAPRTVVFEDDGLFIMSAYFNGVAHPPGYPLYTLLGHIMTWIPLGSVAYRVHALSSVFAAMGCGLLWSMVAQLVPGRVYAYAASLMFGFSPIFWSQSIVAEVYSLNVLMIVLLLSLSLSYLKTEGDRSIRIIRWIGLVYGLGLCNHWPLLFLSTPMLILVMWPCKKRLLGQIKYTVPFLLLGLLPYAWMVYRSQMDPAISFYGPLLSWQDFWYTVTRAGYQEADQSLSAGWWDKWMFCSFVLRESIHQYGIAGFILIIIGFIAQWRVYPIHLAAALVVGFVGNTFVLILLLGFDFDLFHKIIFRVYPIVAYLVLSIWLATGLFWSINRIIQFRIKNLSDNVLKGGSALLLVSISFLTNAGPNYRATDDRASHYARTVLDNIDTNSIIFLDADLSVASLGYLNKVEKYRQDIRLYQNYGLVFKERLFRGDNKFFDIERFKILEDFISSSNESIYIENVAGINVAREYYGLYNRVTKDISSNKISYIYDAEIYRYYLNVFMAGEPLDPFGYIMYRYHKRNFCILTNGLSNYVESVEKKMSFQKMVGNYCGDFYGNLGQLYQLLNHDDIDWKKVERLLISAKAQADQAVSKDDVKLLYNIQTMLEDEQGK